MQTNPISLQANDDSSRGLSGILGALVGDALGVPFEFKPPEQIPTPDMIEMLMPESFRKTYAAIPYGTWSDDGSQLLCLYENMTTHREFVPGHFGELLMRWYGDAHHQAGGRVFDCGGQTARAIRNFEAGIAPLECGGQDDRSNGNGSLMRVLPVAVVGRRLGWGRGKLIGVAHDQSRVTHAHPVSQVCCALYVLLASDLLDRPALSAAEGLDQASHFLKGFYLDNDQPQHRDALASIMAYPQRNFLRGSGFVVDALWSAVKSVSDAGNYMDAVRRAISYGNDTDTTACIAGGLAGIKWGIEDELAQDNCPGIPRRWLNALQIPDESRLLLV